ncbi:polysaccharide pyruvyl transferase family protein [Algibacter sp. Ld11]|uniref:polysaccharide pyruvyl transferase family protein n=1 Tax=Algibacter sp. Ld11 TaxID=649150 RepID=UPI00386DB6F1
MKKILIKNFKNLNNYGSGMMGLITLSEIYNRLDGNVKFYSDFDEYADMTEILKELNIKNVDLNIYTPKKNVSRNKIAFLKYFYTLKAIFSNEGANEFDLVVVLGGDDLSEYYGKHIWPVFLNLNSWASKTKVVLFGQSIGPFKHWYNRFTFKILAAKTKIFTRDEYCFNYLSKNLGIKKNITLSGDIAFLKLPLEDDKKYEDEILEHYKLEKDKYVSIVISGLFGKYYTKNIDDYFNTYEQLISRLKNNPKLKGYKICLLAHTFPPHGNEADLLIRFEDYLKNKKDVIFIKDKVHQAAARFILGNGALTITGRMHASVSTFEMGKPSISLAYSVKYYGVIGDNLGRNDLIIDANDSNLWKSNVMVNMIDDKVNYILDDYDNILEDISEKVDVQKNLVNNAFHSLLNDL